MTCSRCGANQGSAAPDSAPGGIPGSTLCTGCAAAAYDFFAAPPSPPAAPPFGAGFGAQRVGGSSAPPLSQRPPERRSLLTVVLATLAVLAVVGGVVGYFMLQGAESKNEMAAVDHGLALAHRMELQTALQNAAEDEESWATGHDGYTTSLAQLAQAGWSPPPGVTVTVLSASPSGYCLQASDPQGATPPWYFSRSTGSPSPTPCR